MQPLLGRGRQKRFGPEKLNLLVSSKESRLIGREFGHSGTDRNSEIGSYPAGLSDEIPAVQHLCKSQCVGDRKIDPTRFGLSAEVERHLR